MPRPLEDLRDPAGEALDDVDEVVLGRDDRADAVDLDQGELRPVMGVDHRLLALRVEARQIAELVGRPHSTPRRMTENWKTGTASAKSQAPSSPGMMPLMRGAGRTCSAQKTCARANTIAAQESMIDAG